MYTKLLKMVVKLKRQMAGHCDIGGGSGSGHCS
jgi:hypothetical protein